MSSYPYSPPYAAINWSQSQDQNFKVRFQLPPTRPHVIYTYTGHTSTENIFSTVLPSQTEFVAWDSFHTEVQQAKDDVTPHNTNLSSRQVTTVMGTFVGAHYDLTNDAHVENEAAVSTLVKVAYSSVVKIFQRLDHQSTILRTAERARLQSSLFRFGGSPTIDFVFIASALDPALVQPRHRLVAVEVKRVNFPLTASAVFPNTANQLAAHHGTKYKTDGPAWYVRMMSQALIYAMHTKNGCVIVTNHNLAMFMKVEPSQSSNSSTWKLKVKVSQLYKCNKSPSTFHTVLAILRKSTEASDISSHLRRAFSQLQEARLPTRRTRSQTQNRPATRRRGVASSATHQPQGSASSATHHVQPTHDATILPKHDNPDAEAVLAPLYQPELIRHLMEASDDIITSEGHSTVLRSWYDDLDVAVKYWNCDTKFGLDMLLHEIDVYEEVVLKHSHLLGRVLPRLIALWKEPRTAAVIVSEYVGEAVTRRVDSFAQTVLLVGTKVLDTNECRLFLDAAFYALQILHSTGLRHKDLDERNIRASREVDEQGNVIWKVWFIDLGLASFSGDLQEAEKDENDQWRAIRC